MEYKAIPTYTKDIVDRTVTGFASIFGVVDDGLDIVERGAFKRTLDHKNLRVKHLWQHDAWLPPVASIKEIREAGIDELPDQVREEYPEATGGLLVKREYFDTERGNEILSGLKSSPPAITEMSFGFDAIQARAEEMDAQNGEKIIVRRLKELRLWDTSDVNWGMNRATVAQKATAALAIYKDSISPEMYKALDALLNFTSRTMMPEHLRQLSDANSKSLERFYAALDELNDVLFSPDPPDDHDERLKALTETLRLRLAAYEREALTISGV